VDTKKNKMKWISIKEKMPDLQSGHSDKIIVYDGERVVDDCNYIPEWGGFICHAYGYDNDTFTVDGVTHWMPLPEPPVSTK
jgi:hypothetical protein